MNAALRIAVVENDAQERAGLRQLLASAGYQIVAEAASPAALVEAIAAAGPPPDLIVVAAVGSDPEGVQPAAEIFNRQCAPVVVITSEGAGPEWQQARRYRPFAHLIRPLRELELCAAIDVAFQRWLEFQSLDHTASALRQALEDRKLIERAKGVIMQRQGLDEAAAFQRLQKLARNRRQKLAETARNIVLAESNVTACLVDAAR